MAIQNNPNMHPNSLRNLRPSCNIRQQRQPDYKARTDAASPRWKQAWTLRRQGHTYAQIGTALGVSLWVAFKIITKYESYRLNQTNQ